MIKPMSTRDIAGAYHKALLYTQHGWGKTTQAKHMKRRYGKGLILSGEGGLRSLMGESIDYIAFSSWQGEPKPDTYSFVQVCDFINSPAFAKAGYKWIMLDSITELSDLCYEHWNEKHKGSKNGFALWQDYASSFLGALKWIRDLHIHVLVTALAKDETTDNGDTEWWPLIQGSRIQKQVPGIFDHVLGGVRVYEENEVEVGGTKRKVGSVRRWLVTEKFKGWQGKVRDPLSAAPPYMETGDVTQLFDKLDGVTKAAAAPAEEVIVGSGN